MKRILTFLLTLTIFITGSFSTITKVSAANTKPSVKAHAYMVMDAHSGKKLYPSNANKKIYPASTVKVMTAVIALDKLKTTKKIKFTKAMRKQVKSVDIAHLGLKVGATYTVNDYLHMMLLCSDADSAIALAVGACGSTSAFVNKMNEKAEIIGMNKTSFDNPIGLDVGNGYNNTYTTANDFAKLARYAMRYESIRTIVAKSSYKVPKTSKSKSFTIHNTNAFYSQSKYESNRFQVIGLKTGTTKAAGHVLIAVAEDDDGHEVICSFFGKSTDQRKYQDIKNLLNYTFTQYNKGKIILSKGFWDTRFQSSEAMIRKYATQDVLEGEDGRFYPEKKITQGEFANWTNAIALTELETDSEEELSVQALAQMLVPYLSSEVEQTVLDEILKELENLPEDATLQNQIALLYANEVITTNVTKDVSYTFTREEALAIADGLPID